MSIAAGQAAVDDSSADDEPAVTVEKRGHLLLIGPNRPKKYNAFNLDLIDQLARAYYRVENDPDIRCGVVFGHGKHFTGGLDLEEVGPKVEEGILDFSRPGLRDPSVATRGRSIDVRATRGNSRPYREISSARQLRPQIFVLK